MKEVPEAWPPAGEERQFDVPMFPLPNVFLVPTSIMPLHIFEPRYRQMVEDLLDGPGRLVIATIRAEHESDGAPPVHEIGGLGEIARHERLPGGRFLIWVVGLCRVRLREVASRHPYRRVIAEPVIEIPAGDAVEHRLRPEIVEALLARSPEMREVPDTVPLSCLTDWLLMRLDLPPASMQELYARVEIAERARRALLEHERRPIPPSGEPDPDGSGPPASPDT